MKRTIAIVAGGDSSELPVSLRSAQGIYSFIDKERYNLYIVEMEGHRWEVILPDGTKTPIDRNDFGFMENGEKKLFDFAYITIHGTPGENGILQGYFDLLGIPYSSCNVLVSAITFNKFTCNQYLKGFGIRVSESLILRKGFEITDQEVISKIGLPCFIKPNAGGSSFGVTKVKTEEEKQPYKPEQNESEQNKPVGEEDEVPIQAELLQSNKENDMHAGFCRCFFRDADEHTGSGCGGSRTDKGKYFSWMSGRGSGVFAVSCGRLQRYRWFCTDRKISELSGFPGIR